MNWSSEKYAAYTYTFKGIGDAVKAITTPVDEVQISNTAAREEFSQLSFIAPNEVILSLWATDF
jgi:3-dehydroquinate dehydratase